MKTRSLEGDRVWKIDPALTYFRATHYHRPWLLDCRVRKGNGYFQPGMGTGRRFTRSCPTLRPKLEAKGHCERWVGLVKRDREVLSEDEIKPIDWLVPVS